ncbi:ankyrin, partial [Sodiomyces alkalinus F11]
RLLIKYSSSVDSIDRSGYSTILYVVDSHDNRAVRILLEAGADPNPKVPEGLFRSSPLKAASFSGRAEIVKLLLHYRAEINACNPEGYPALYIAVITQNIDYTRILLESGASLEDVAHNGRTPLTLAIIHNSHAILELLVEHVTTAHVEGP